MNGIVLVENYSGWLINGSAYMDKLSLIHTWYAQDASMQDEDEDEESTDHVCIPKKLDGDFFIAIDQLGTIRRQCHRSE